MIDKHFARRVVSRYAGVPARQVAEAEGVAEVTVREVRKSLGRGAELGHTREDTLLGAGPAELQLSFASLDGMMRANRGVRL
jgi:hypothetical protein